MRDVKTFIVRFLGAGCLFVGMAGVLLAADERKAQIQAAVKIREVNVGGYSLRLFCFLGLTSFDILCFFIA